MQEKALLGSFPVTAIDGVMEVCCSPDGGGCAMHNR